MITPSHAYSPKVVGLDEKAESVEPSAIVGKTLHSPFCGQIFCSSSTKTYSVVPRKYFIIRFLYIMVICVTMWIYLIYSSYFWNTTLMRGKII